MPNPYTSSSTRSGGDGARTISRAATPSSKAADAALLRQIMANDAIRQQDANYLDRVIERSQPKSAKSQIPNSARQMKAAAAKITRRIPALKLAKMLADLAQITKKQEGSPPYPDYGPSMKMMWECPSWGPEPPDAGPPHMRGYALMNGACGGPNPVECPAWDRWEVGSVWPSYPAHETGAFVKEIEYIGAAHYQQVLVYYERSWGPVGEPPLDSSHYPPYELAPTFKGWKQTTPGRQAAVQVEIRPKAGSAFSTDLPWPALSPSALQPGRLMPSHPPHPIPRDWLKARPMVDPMRAPSEQSQRGDGPGDPSFDPPPPKKGEEKPNRRRNVAKQRPDPAQDADAGVDLAIDSSGKPMVKPRPERDFAWPRPPRIREKERKVRINAPWRRLILSGVNMLTEGIDYLDAFYKALPKDKKRLAKHRGLKIMRPQHKLEVLYANWRHVDMQEAVRNLIENEVEDRVFGGIGQNLAAGINRDMGRPVGVQTGPGSPSKVPAGTKVGPKPWDNWTKIVLGP